MVEEEEEATLEAVAAAVEQAKEQGLAMPEDGHRQQATRPEEADRTTRRPSEEVR